MEGRQPHYKFIAFVTRAAAFRRSHPCPLHRVLQTLSSGLMHL